MESEVSAVCLRWNIVAYSLGDWGTDLLPHHPVLRGSMTSQEIKQNVLLKATVKF